MNFILALLLVFSAICSPCYGFDYKGWWESWYASGGLSGAGSVGELAQFKADVINDFLEKKHINSVVEFGCGDGVNLKMIHYKSYLGFDISPTIIKRCITKFENDPTKSFMLYDPNFFVNNTLKQFDLVVCLDVLYHVIDETEYKKLLDDIFSFSAPYVILYTTLEDDKIPHNNPEIKHRNVFDYLKKYSNYRTEIIKQKHQDLTRAAFIILTKKD